MKTYVTLFEIIGNFSFLECESHRTCMNYIYEIQEVKSMNLNLKSFINWLVNTSNFNIVYIIRQLAHKIANFENVLILQCLHNYSIRHM